MTKSMDLFISRLAWALAGVAMILLAVGVQAGPLPALTADGTRFVDPAGKPVVLRGCNLGNWLILESWMFGGTLTLDGKPFKDQATLYAKLDERFGREKAGALMDAFRAAYVTPRDFDLIKSFGFNVVRLPFDYRNLQDDTAPDRLRPDAFRWLDHALDLAEKAGVYVILDLHGVPGGQSKQDHTGQADVNRLWTDKACQDRTMMLWTAIADRYKGRSVVAAYDLINEPYSNMNDDVRDTLADLCPRLAKAVRGTGDTHVIFYPGALNRGIGFYGDPKRSGLTNIGFTEHYYPGLFGSKPALDTHARLLGAGLPAKKAQLDRLAAVYLVGEFNVVLRSESPNELMRLYYDRFADYGWAGTMWSYKLLKTDAGAAPSAWYMVTNADALPAVGAATASYEEIEKAFRALATAPVAVNEPLRAALTNKAPPALPLSKYTPLPTAAPTTPSAEPAGYRSRDIGGAASGHTKAAGDTLEITAGGTDINADADGFRFVAKPMTGDGELRATIVALADSSEYAKAGVMARWGEAAGAPMVLVNAFPDGTVALISRAQPEGPTSETKFKAGLSLPIQLRLTIKDGRATAAFRGDRGAWKPAGGVSVRGGAFALGVAACAHADEVFTVAEVALDAAGDAALPAAGAADRRPAGTSLLANGPFEQPGPEGPDRAAHWNRWGDWINYENSWTPTHDGKGLIGYHHWRIEKPGSSGIWQDVKVEPGKRYTFTVFAQRDLPEANKQEAATLELRLESVTPGGQITLDNRDFDVGVLATGKAWSRLSITGTATSDTLRVLAVINASAESDRGGAVKIDDATLTVDGK